MNVLRLTFGIWLVVVAVRFCITLIRSVANPFNSGGDWMWCSGWTICCAVLPILAATSTFRKRRIRLIPLLPAIAIVYLSGNVGPALAALWLFLLSAGVGAFILRKVVGKNEATIDYLVCGVPLGTAVISLTILILGLTGHLTVFAVATFCLALSAASVAWGWRDLYPPGAQPATTPEKDTRLLCALMGALGLVYLVWAIAPEIQFDALNYHLAVPEKYLENSRVVDLHFFHAYFARFVEFFFAACLALGGAATVKIWIFLMSCTAVWAVYALGECSFERRVGFWAAALFMATPIVGWLFGTAYIDNVIALFVTASFVALVRWTDSHNERWLYVAGMIAGMAVGSKVSALLAYAVVAPIVAFRLKRDIRTLALAAIAFAVVATPTYVLIYSLTDNPIFPLMNGVFHSSKWSFDNRIMNAGDYGLPVSFASFIRFPFRFTFDTIRFGEGLPRGSAGLTLLFAFPFAATLWPKARTGQRLMIFAAAGFLVLLFFTMQYARYYITILPIIAVLGVATIFHLLPNGMARPATMVLLIVFMVQPLVHSVQFWNIPGRFPVALATGLEDKESFLRRALRGYLATEYLNSVTTKTDRILGVETENLRFYLRAELQTMPLSLFGDAIRRLSDMTPDEELAASIKRLNFRYLLVLRTALENPAPWYPYLQRGFLAVHADTAYEDEHVVVYRLR